MIELMVVDDEDLIGQLFKDYGDHFNKKYSLNIAVTYFDLASDAINNINFRTKDYNFYFVDMRIPQELDLSEKLFYIIKNKFSIKRFYFMTGHVSEHDEKILNETKMPLIMKPFNALELFNNISKNKNIENYLSM